MSPSVLDVYGCSRPTYIGLGNAHILM